MTRRTATAGHARSRTDRLAQWWSGWRVAVVTAWRDARRHRGTTALIMIMIGLPVLLITGFATVVSTFDVSPAERLHWELGNATAKITAPVEGGHVIQSTDGALLVTDATPCESDNCPTSKAPSWTASGIARVTGGTAYAIDNGRVAVTQGDRPLVVPALTLDAGGFAATGIATLTSGSWPTAPGQVVVSPELVSRVLPSSGTITLSIDGAARSMTVVGTARATDDQGQPYGVIGLTGAFGDFAAQPDPSFLVTRAHPFTWDEIEQLNAQGLLVVAPEFVLHPGRADLTGEYASVQPSAATPTEAAIIVLIVFGLLLETTLLAGPAFAVSTARRRRTLALVASNGGTRRQLRRYVLGQGLVMGVVAAAVGAALGVLLPAVGFPLADRIEGSRLARGPFQPSWPVLATSAIAAVIAALVAASIAARGTSRLDIAQTLAGRTQPRVRRGVRHLAMPVIMALVTTGAMVGCAIIALAPDPQPMLMPAVILSIIVALGGLFLVGTVIDLVGRLRSGSIAMRLALRDGRRNRSRTLPAVAAITATVTMITMLTISNTSDMAQQIRDYTPQTPYGVGQVFPGSEQDLILAEIHRQQPDWHTAPLSRVGHLVQRGGELTFSTTAVPNGCTAAQALDQHDRGCATNPDILAAPAWAAVTPPPADVSATIRNGDAAVVGDPRLVHDGKVTLAISANGSSKPRTVSLPAVLAPAAALTAAIPNQGLTVWIPSALAAQDHLPLTEQYTLVRDPSGPISATDEQAVDERVVNDQLHVERGPLVGSTRVLLVGMLAVGGFLALVAALIATALGRAEGRADLATISAVGGSGLTLRRIAAAQALLVSVLGVGMGFLTGLLPGMALAAVMTGNVVGDHPPRPIIDIPWARLLGGLAAAAILAGLLAAASVRRLPLVRRVE